MLENSQELSQLYTEAPDDLSSVADLASVKNQIVQSNFSPDMIDKLLRDALPPQIFNFFILSSVTLKTTYLTEEDIELLVVDFDLLISNYYLAIPSALRNYMLRHILKQVEMLFFLMCKKSYEGFQMDSFNTLNINRKDKKEKAVPAKNFLFGER